MTIDERIEYHMRATNGKKERIITKIKVKDFVKTN